MKINNNLNIYGNTNSTYSKNFSASKQSFKGARINMIKYAINKNKSMDKDFFTFNVSSFLEMESNGINKYTKKLKQYKMDLLFSLASKFNLEKQKLTPNKKIETKNVLFRIYDKISNPQKTHQKLIENTELNFEEIDKIIDLIGNNKNKLSLVDNLVDIYEHTNGKSTVNAKTIENFLSTQESNNISKNFEQYKPFVIINKDKENVAELLEKEIQKGYNAQYFMHKLEVKSLIENSCVLKNLDQELIIEHYNKPGLKLLEKLDTLYSATTPNEQKEIKNKTHLFTNIYNTTTNENQDIREKIIDNVTKRLPFRDRTTEAPLETIFDLFNQIETNDSANNLVKMFFENEFEIYSIKKLEESISKSDFELIKNYPKEARIYTYQNKSTSGFNKEQAEKIQKMLKEAQEENHKPTLKEKIKLFLSK